MTKDKNCWCPVCFDSLEVKEIKNKEGFIIKFEYYCFGCDKTFILIEKEKLNALKMP